MDSPYTDSSGRSVPRATTILDQLSKPALIQWAANCAVDYIANKEDYGEMCLAMHQAKYAYKQESQEAVEYGSYIHSVCELYLRTGQKIESPHEMTHQFMNGTGNKRLQFNGFYDFCEKTHLKPLLIEQVVIGDGYGGRYDLICEIDKFWDKSDERVVTMIDFKSGKDTFYETWGYQLAGYKFAWNNWWVGHSTGPRNEFVDYQGVLKFNKTNNRVNYKDFTPTCEKDDDIFRTLVSLWWLRNGE